MVTRLGACVILILSCESATADTNLVITDFSDGYLTWTNVDSSLYYSIQWMPSLTDTNGWGESFRMLQDVQSTNELIQVPVPMFFRVVGRSDRTHTQQLNPESNQLTAGYYEGADLTAIEPDLSSNNIAEGTTVFGVKGALLPSGGTATSNDVLSGKTFYGAGQSNWVLQTGTYGSNQNGPGYYDLNGSPEDGYEFHLDTNGIYVSTVNGDDSADGFGPIGTGHQPVKTVSHALSVAQNTGRSTIYVSNGMYNESIDLPGGVDLLGGFDPDDWSRTILPSSSTILRGTGNKTISMQDATTSTVIEGFMLFGINTETSRQNTYTVWLYNNSAEVALSNNVIYAGYGGDGTRGADGADGSNGQDGSDGSDAVAPFSARSGGSGGVFTCGGTDVNGGDGGGNSSSPSYATQTSADNGSAGMNSGGSGGAGGYDAKKTSQAVYFPTGNVPFDGCDGSDGANGSSGFRGWGASDNDGVISSGNWVATSGSSGGAGELGRGGGGGGAGGGSEDSGGGSVAGGTGGGGGSGGCAGQGGTGGSGGGGSFCIFVDGGTAPLISDSTFYLGYGGNGGDGGMGGIGGTGGSGGAGGARLYGGGKGGNGGSGGNGGAGGGGGGGAGGISCGILIHNISETSAETYQSNNTFIGGAGGKAGKGGYSMAEPGEDGVDGAVIEVDVR